MTENIDFVVTWVDDTDKDWQHKRSLYSKERSKSSIGKTTFREWGTFKYWFRGVEKNAPWVNKIYLVTDHQCPKWLNVNHEKIVLVNHDDYIPEDALPTFNTNAITAQLHKIPGLAQKFVYFNDDMYILNPVKPEDFFFKDLPCDMSVYQPIAPYQTGTAHFQVNNMGIINKYFNKKDVSKYSLVYGKENIRSFLFDHNKFIPGFYETHLPESFLKRTFKELWEKEETILNQTLHSKFRNNSDTSEWLFRDWQLASKKFYPRNNDKFGKLLELRNASNQDIWKLIKKSSYKVLCVNDNAELKNPEAIQKEFIKALDYKLTKKSKFEI